MTDDPDERPALSHRDRQFIERLRALTKPQPMTPMRRTALDARVRASLDRRRRLLLLAPAPALIILAVLAIIWIRPLPPVSEPTLEPRLGGLETVAPDGWERRLFYGEVGGTSLERGDFEDQLPPEYAAIEQFFDG